MADINPSFHGETSEPDLPEIVQLQLTRAEFYFIVHCLAYYAAGRARDFIGMIQTDLLVRTSPLGMDRVQYDAFIDKLNDMTKVVFKDADFI